MLPSVGKFLTYVKGLRPKKRIGFAFGSYGWGGQAVGQIEEAMKELGWELPADKVNINYVPDESELANVVETGKKLGNIVKDH
jgi:flavorubredoxin